jgi:nucleotide-binding universal stress UspA family protein
VFTQVILYGNKTEVMKTIIVATDYSLNANNALQYAAELATYTKSKLILFNSYTLPVHASNTLLSANVVDELIGSNEEYLQNIAEETSNRYEIEVDYFTKLSNFEEELDELVLKTKAELVVMGMHESDWSDSIVGNTTTAVIRHAKYPVLVIPQTAFFKPTEKILFAFDSDCIYPKNKLSVFKEIANCFHAEVQVFHVETVHEHRKNVDAKTSDDVIKGLSECDPSYKDVYVSDVIAGIEKGIEEFGADLVVMVPHKLTFWEALGYSSKTRKMALRTNVPLLVLPNSTSILEDEEPEEIELAHF